MNTPVQQARMTVEMSLETKAPFDFHQQLFLLLLHTVKHAIRASESSDRLLIK